MTTDTITEKQVSEEEKDNARFEELKQKGQLDETEQKEMDGLKQRYSDRVQKRIDVLQSKALDAENRYGQASKEVEELKRKVAELEAARNEQPVRVIQDTVEIAGKKYWTDDALLSKVKAGEMTENEAYKLQRDRDKAEIREDLRRDLANESKESEDQRLRREDAERVLKDYPQFSDKHPDFNPNDPLYKEVTRIYNNGYSIKPNGLSEAIKDAKRILRMEDKRPDLSNEFNVNSPSAPGRQEKQEVTLTAAEEEAAIRQYTMGDAPMNPATGRNYTRDEAIKKAIKAKQRRMESRRVM